MAVIGYKWPQDPVLARILSTAQKRDGNEKCFFDVVGHKKSYNDIFGDAMRTRDLIRAKLPSLLDERGLIKEENPFIGVLTRSGYEFLVSMIAIRSLGGACMPFGSGILPEEAHYFLKQTKSAALLFGGADCGERGAKIAAYVQEQGDELVTVAIITDAPPVDTASIEIDEALKLSETGPGIIVFSSGTTGIPKSAVLPRRAFSQYPYCEPGEGTINFRPAYWVGGCYPLMNALVTGKQLHILGEHGTVEAILDTFKNHRITDFIFTPLIARGMKEALVGPDGELPAEKREEVASWFKSLHGIFASAGLVEPSLKKWWIDLTGQPWTVAYGSTEQAGFSTQTRGQSKFENSIGFPLPDMEIKLSEGNQGELLVKSPYMFTHYAGNEKATMEAFNEEGYYKSGDLVEMRDGEFIFLGRANNDFIFFQTYRIPTQTVEHAIMGLPYVAEACVLPIPDHESKNLCAALVRLKPGVSPVDVDLRRIRSDIADEIPAFMFPTLLRILREGESVPLTTSGKPVKKRIRTEFFATEDWWPMNNPPADVESWADLRAVLGEKPKAWDWGGIQRVEA